MTEYEPGQEYGFKSLSGPLSSQTYYSLGMGDNGCTKIKISVQADVLNFFQMEERILEEKMQKQLEEDLGMLKDLLETKSFAG